MIGLNQADNFTRKIKDKWPHANSDTFNIIRNLSEEKLAELWELYKAGYYTSINKPSDKRAVAKLDGELFRLGILN